MTGAPALHWPVEALARALGLAVEVRAEADSSNTRLLEAARAGDSAPRLLVVERQSAGRGRQGRPWIAAEPAPGRPPGPALLAFSLGLPFAPRDWSGLSLAVGVALAEALGDPVQLKWPNDLWLGAGRKLGGILIETLALPGDARYAVVGVGLNLEAPRERAELHSPAAGWREVEPGASAATLLGRVAAPLRDALRVFEREGFAAFAARHAVLDGLRGMQVQAQGRVGRAEGVDARGALRLATPEGPVLIDSGDVSVRPC